MFKDLLNAFTRQFPHWRFRLLVIGLMIVMAAVPVGELLIFRQFAQLLVEGVGAGEDAGQEYAGHLVLFFVGFALIRALNHVTKFVQVRLFRRAFADLQDEAGVGAASWQWSQAFSVSNAIADLIQVSAVLALLFWLDTRIGGVISVMFVLVMIMIALLYRRQIRVQRAFIEDAARRVETGIRERIFSAEVAGISASIAAGVALALIAWSTLTGATALATAIVLAMGAKMFFGRVAGLAPIFMRFARDSLRLERDLGRAGGRPNAFDGDDDLDGDARPAADDGRTTDGPPVSDERRAAAAGPLMIAAQRGDRSQYGKLATSLGPASGWTERDHAAVHAAESFLEYATAGTKDETPPLHMFWWPRPLPGTFDEWVTPFLVQRATGRAVRFVPLLGGSEVPPHLVMGSSLLEHAVPNSIVVASGASRREVQVPPDAEYVSVRGPMTARIVSRNGGPVVNSFGDARLLVRRVHRLPAGETNGRLAFVRDRREARTPYILPESIDEVSLVGSKREEIVTALETLRGYDGIVTSSLGVVTLCHSYGIPCALTVHERSPRAPQLDFELRDHLLGAGLSQEWEAHRVTTALGRIDWRSRLLTEAVSAEKLDEIGDAVTLAIFRHAEAEQDALEREFGADREYVD